MRRAWVIAAAIAIGGCAKPAPLSEREAAMRLLAEHLAVEVRPRAVLVLSNPFSQQSGRPAEIYEFERASLRGLASGFGEATPIKNAFPELRPEALQDAANVYVDPKTTTPLSFLVAENAFQKAVEQHPDCDLVISLIGLPVNVKAFPAWSKPGAPRFALLLPDWRMIGGKNAISEAFKSGKLAAAMVRKLNADDDSFLLVTGASVDELLATQPQLFGLQ
jgi:hypothetical protein